MPGMSGTEVVIVAVMALLLIGPEGMPQAAKFAGRSVKWLRSDDQQGQWLLALAALLTALLVALAGR